MDKKRTAFSGAVGAMAFLRGLMDRFASWTEMEREAYLQREAEVAWAVGMRAEMVGPLLRTLDEYKAFNLRFAAALKAREAAGVPTREDAARAREGMGLDAGEEAYLEDALGAARRGIQ